MVDYQVDSLGGGGYSIAFFIVSREIMDRKAVVYVTLPQGSSEIQPSLIRAPWDWTGAPVTQNQVSIPTRTNACFSMSCWVSFYKYAEDGAVYWVCGGDSHAMVFKTCHLHKQATFACERMFNMATAEEECPIEGGAQIREGQVREGCVYMKVMTSCIKAPLLSVVFHTILPP